MARIGSENIMGLLFHLAGLALIITSIYLAQAQFKFIGLAQHTQGTVIEMHHSFDPTSKGKLAHTYYPIVRFSDIFNQTHEVQSHFGANPPQYQRGDIVPVLYTPNQPQEAEIESFEALWTAPILTGVIGVGFFVSSFFLHPFGWLKKSSGEQ